MKKPPTKRHPVGAPIKKRSRRTMLQAKKAGLVPQTLSPADKRTSLKLHSEGRAQASPV